MYYRWFCIYRTITEPLAGSTGSVFLSMCESYFSASGIPAYLRPDTDVGDGPPALLHRGRVEGLSLHPHSSHCVRGGVPELQAWGREGHVKDEGRHLEGSWEEASRGEGCVRGSELNKGKEAEKGK